MLFSRAHLCVVFAMSVPVLAFSSNTLVSPEMKKAAGQVTTNGIAAHIKYLASDLLEGRGPATRGDKLAQTYITKELQSLGLKPGASDGGWLQPVPLVGITSHTPSTMKLSAGAKDLTLKYSEDFMAVTGVQKESAKISDAELVFVGYGIDAPEFQWNDFKDVDVKGKVLVVMNHNPSVFAGKTRLWYGRWDYKFERAAKNGAAGVIIIHTTPSAAYPWQVVQSSWSGEQFELLDEGSPRLQMRGWATEESSRKIVALGGKDLDALRASAESRDFRPVPLGVKLSIEIPTTIEKTQSANIIGVLPGTDPKLSKEAILYTAHHDHLGIKDGAKPGEKLIYHGALDNASGVAAVLAIAKAFVHFQNPLKRSVYFVLLAAEEQGLLGSLYFAAHPPVPPGQMAVDINIDGIGFYGKTHDISAIGFGKSSLDKDLTAIAATQGRIVTPDLAPDKGAFYRADQFSFAKIGVPGVYLEPGLEVPGKPADYGQKQHDFYTENDYHQPSDQYRETYDFSGAVEDLQLQFFLGVHLANASQMPTWKKGDEFEAARMQNLKTVGQLPSKSRK